MELHEERQERSFSKLMAMLKSIPRLPRTRFSFYGSNGEESHASGSSGIPLEGYDNTKTYTGRMNGSAMRHSESETHTTTQAQAGEQLQRPKNTPSTRKNVIIITNKPASKSTLDAQLASMNRNAASGNQAQDAGPSAVTAQSHVKRLSEDCYADLSQPLPPPLQRAWNTTLHNRLQSTLSHKLSDSKFSLEGVMTKPSCDDRLVPTVLVMCMSAPIKATIERILGSSYYVPPTFQLKVLVLDVGCCSLGTWSGSELPQEFIGLGVTALFRGKQNEVFGNLCKIQTSSGRQQITAKFTVGGVISIDEALYGLTVGHCLHVIPEGEVVSLDSSGERSTELLLNALFWDDICPLPFLDLEHNADSRIDESLELASTREQTPIIADGDGDNQITPTELGLGHVVEAQWPKINVRDSNVEDPKSGVDWMLVEIDSDISSSSMNFNRFYIPGEDAPRIIHGYYNTEDLKGGPVWICGGVTGVQPGYLSHNLSSVYLAGTYFRVISISLQHSLQAGDSGSWVIRDNYICGYIVFTVGEGIPWAYMIPMADTIGAIAQRWKTSTLLNPKSLSPTISITSGNLQTMERSGVLAELPYAAASHEDSPIARTTGITPIKPSSQESITSINSNAGYSRRPENLQHRDTSSNPNIAMIEPSSEKSGNDAAKKTLFGKDSATSLAMARSNTKVNQHRRDSMDREFFDSINRPEQSRLALIPHQKAVSRRITSTESVARSLELTISPLPDTLGVIEQAMKQAQHSTDTLHNDEISRICHVEHRKSKRLFHQQRTLPISQYVKRSYTIHMTQDESLHLVTRGSHVYLSTFEPLFPILSPESRELQREILILARMMSWHQLIDSHLDLTLAKRLYLMKPDTTCQKWVVEKDRLLRYLESINLERKLLPLTLRRFRWFARLAYDFHVPIPRVNGDIRWQSTFECRYNDTQWRDLVEMDRKTYLALDAEEQQTTMFDDTPMRVNLLPHDEDNTFESYGGLRDDDQNDHSSTLVTTHARCRHCHRYESSTIDVDIRDSRVKDAAVPSLG